MQSVQRACAGGGKNKQRQGAQALRVRSQSERGDEQSGRVARGAAGAPGQYV